MPVTYAAFRGCFPVRAVGRNINRRNSEQYIRENSKSSLGLKFSLSEDVIDDVDGMKVIFQRQEKEINIKIQKIKEQLDNPLYGIEI